jgi:D-alanyl-D-alanine carboxypeptidase
MSTNAATVVRVCAVLLLNGSAASLAAQSLDHTRLTTSLDSLAAKQRDSGRPPGLTLLVAQGPEPVFAKGYGYADLDHDVPATTRTVYSVASITKQFVTAAVLRLAEEGRLRLDDELATYIPEFRAQARGVTLRHLANHTSGVPRATAAAGRNAARIDQSREDVLAALIEQYTQGALNFTPGEAWAYRDVNSMLLAFVVEKVAGQSIWSYFHEQFFAPLGMTQTGPCDPAAVTKHRATGYVVSGGAEAGIAVAPLVNPDEGVGATGLCSTAPDLLRWQRGLVEGRVISAESFARMTTPEQLDTGVRLDYGYGVVPVEIEGEPLVFHTGGITGYTAYLAYLPARDVTVVVLANSNTDIFTLGPAVVRAALGLPQPRHVELAPGELDRYVGTYEAGRLRVVVRASGEEMTAAVTGSDSVRFLFAPRLLKQAEHVFAVGWEPSSTLTFLPGEQNARGVVLRYGERTVELQRTQER